MENNQIIFPEDIYKKYLMVINGIKFTPREIDVIACVLHGKNTKSIAVFLSTEEKILGDRAIETHILNIRRKIGGCARESIISFIENSNKYPVVRSYYSSLLIQKEFKKSLQEISTLIKPHVQSFIIYFNSKQETDKFIVQQLQINLKHLILNLPIAILQNSLPDASLVTDINKSYIIYVIPNNEEELYKKLAKGNIKNYCIIINKDIETVDGFTLLQNTPNINNNNLFISRCINMIHQKNYYFLFFEVLSTLFPDIDLSNIIAKFQEKYKNINGNFIHDNIHISEQSINEPNSDHNIRKYLWQWKRYYIYIIIVSCIIISCIFTYSKNIEKRNKEVQQITETKLAMQKHTRELLPKFFKDLSIRNLEKEQIEKNYNIVKQFDQVIDKIISKQINEYFDGNKLTSEELVSCIYNLNAIANYYLFKEHDTEKAENILKYAKSLAENYISSRSRLNIDFDKLTVAEIFTEFSLIKDLPEMYAVTVYFLGRGSIYQRKSQLLESAEKYFNLSKYFGKKLDLYIEVLSDINGLGIVKGDRIDIAINNKNYDQAKDSIKECIEIYENVKENNKEYKLDYRPNNYNPETIIPKENLHTITDCSKRIIKLYSKLIKITDDKNKKITYLQAISKQYIGNNKTPGILTTLMRSIKTNEILGRVAADTYNNLGEFLLKLYDENIDFKQFKNDIVNKLSLTDTNDLEVIYQIFDLAKSLSRNTEFTKADAYDGLIKAQERIIRQSNYTDQNKIKEQREKIVEFQKARDLINQELNRK